MSGINVETDELTVCAKKYRDLAEEFKGAAQSVINKISEYDNVWKGSFTQDFEEKVKKIKSVQDSVYENCVSLADFIDGAVKQYIDVDRGLADKSTIGTADYPDNVDVSYHIEAGQVLDTWKDYGPDSPNGFENHNRKGNCTWYADYRWQQLNPEYPLKFSGSGTRNAGYWDDRIDKNYFNVNSTSDYSKVVSNAIAVKDPTSKYPCGHVAYIEKVQDGMVYFTEDGESYTRPHTWAKNSDGSWAGPIVQCCTLEEFKSKFGKIITRK